MCYSIEAGKIVTVGPYNTFMTLMWSFIPAVFMIILSCLIAVKLYRRLNETTVRSQSTRSVTNPVIIQLTVSLTFAILTLPFGVDFIISGDPFTGDPYKVLLNILLNLNQAVNFFLYCCTSKMFRDELKAMFGIMPNAVTSTTPGQPRNIQPKRGTHSNRTTRTNPKTASTQQSDSLRDKSEDNKNKLEDKSEDNKGTTSNTEVENLRATDQPKNKLKPKGKTSYTDVTNMKTTQHSEDKNMKTTSTQQHCDDKHQATSSIKHEDNFDDKFENGNLTSAPGQQQKKVEKETEQHENKFEDNFKQPKQPNWVKQLPDELQLVDY